MELKEPILGDPRAVSGGRRKDVTGETNSAKKSQTFCSSSEDGK